MLRCEQEGPGRRVSPQIPWGTLPAVALKAPAVTGPRRFANGRRSSSNGSARSRLSRLAATTRCCEVAQFVGSAVAISHAVGNPS